MRKEDLVRVFSNMPTLHSARLTLRRLMPKDAEDMYAYARSPEVTRYLTWREHPSLGYTRQYIDYMTSRYRVGEFYDFAVVNLDDGHMIGTCGFTRFDPPNDAAEIGYVLNPAYWHRGYACEAVSTILRYAFETLHMYRVEARYMKENYASRAVMERCGLKFEGIHRGMMLIKGKYEDIGVCACTRKDYEEPFINSEESLAAAGGSFIFRQDGSYNGTTQKKKEINI